MNASCEFYRLTAYFLSASTIIPTPIGINCFLALIYRQEMIISNNGNSVGCAAGIATGGHNRNKRQHRNT